MRILTASGDLTASGVERLGERVAPAELLRLLVDRPRAKARDPRTDPLRLLRRRPQRSPRAAVELGDASVAAIGARLKARTNCGSCRGEIAGLIGTIGE